MKGFYSQEQLAAIALFSRVARLEPLDCIKVENGFLFVVPEGKAGLAVGKQGMNIKKLEKIVNKKIRVIEFSKDPTKFVSNLLFPMKAKKVEKVGEVVKIICPTVQIKSRIIGRDKKKYWTY